MPKKYIPKGCKKSYTNEYKRNRIAQYKEGDLNCSQFCRENNIPMMTFRDWLDDEKTTGTGKTTALSSKIEKFLVLLVVMLSASGVPFGKNFIQNFVQKGIETGCVTVNPKVKFTNNRPGRAWVAGFRERHKKELTLRKREKLCYRRAKV